MFARILYYFIIIPLSVLPLPVLLLKSRIFSFFMQHLLGYRKQMIRQSLKNSFPEKSEAARKQILSAFYLHFCDLIVESISYFSISKQNAIKRGKVWNASVMNDLYAQGQSIILSLGHYNSWEMAALGGALQIKHKPIVVYTPLKNEFLNQKVSKSREQFGIQLIDRKELKNYLKNYHGEPYVLVLVTDQSPHRDSKSFYWTKFLNQDTAVQFGAEKYAKDFDLPVLFLNISKPKRAHYEFVLNVLTLNPREEKHGAITEMHTRMLEAEIREKPQYWLWSHNRWKIKKPVENVQLIG